MPRAKNKKVVKVYKSGRPTRKITTLKYAGGQWNRTVSSRMPQSGLLRRVNFYKPIGFPQTQLVRMKVNYHTLYTPSGSSPYGEFKMSLTRLNNPLFTTSGTPSDPIQFQPMGYDEWAAFYDKYTVISAKASATFTWAKNAVTSPYYVGVAIIDGEPTTLIPNSGDIDTMRETKAYKMHMFVPAPGISLKKTLTMRWSAKKFFKIKDIKDNQDQIGGKFVQLYSEDIAANTPERNATFVPFVHSYNNGNLSASDQQTTVSFSIEYLVLCTGPKVLGSS